MLAVAIHAADIQDRAGVQHVLEAIPAGRERLRHLWVDRGYTGSGVKTIRHHGYTVEVARPPDDRSHGRWHTKQMPLFKALKGFKVTPRRWVVERTFAWLSRFRRLCMDFEQRPETTAAWIWVATTRMLVQRMAFGKFANTL